MDGWMDGWMARSGTECVTCMESGGRGGWLEVCVRLHRACSRFFLIPGGTGTGPVPVPAVPVPVPVPVVPVPVPQINDD